MNAIANVGLFSGFTGNPVRTAAQNRDEERIARNAALSEAPGLAIALITVFYLVSSLIGLM
jgi:hypothetical protein